MASIKLNGTTSNSVTISAPDNPNTTVYVLPVADGSNGQVLTTNGAGYMSWTTVGVAGANTQIQFNDSGVSNGSANLAFYKSNSTIAVNNAVINASLTVNTIAVGANININTATVSVGNATNNVQINSTGVFLSNVAYPTTTTILTYSLAF